MSLETVQYVQPAVDGFLWVEVDGIESFVHQYANNVQPMFRLIRLNGSSGAARMRCNLPPPSEGELAEWVRCGDERGLW